MVDGDEHGHMHAITCSHTQTRRQTCNCMHEQRLTYTHTHTCVVWRWHTPVLTDIQVSNAHSVIYILVFQSPPSVSLVGRILVLEHKAIRKQNAGNINENWDFSERLNMKKEGVVEEVGMWCSKKKTPWKVHFFLGVNAHSVVKVYSMILFVYWLICVSERQRHQEKDREGEKGSEERERGQSKLMKHFLT